MKLTAPMFRELCRQAGLPQPDAEHRFHPVRKWRFDYAWPNHKLAVEVQGGIWTGGKHGRGSGIAKDIEKAAHAAAMGWRILPVVPSKLAHPDTLALIRDALTYVTVELT